MTGRPVVRVTAADAQPTPDEVGTFEVFLHCQVTADTPTEAIALAVACVLGGQ